MKQTNNPGKKISYIIPQEQLDEMNEILFHISKAYNIAEGKDEIRISQEPSGDIFFIYGEKKIIYSVKRCLTYSDIVQIANEILNNPASMYNTLMKFGKQQPYSMDDEDIPF